MRIIGENTEIRANHPGIDFAVDTVVDMQWTQKRMYLDNLNVLLHRLPLCMAVIPENFRSRTTIKVSAKALFQIRRILKLLNCLKFCMYYTDIKGSSNLSVTCSPFRTSQRVWDSL